MKITIVTSGLRPNYSGGNVHVNNVVKRLTKYFEVEFVPSINFLVGNDNAKEEVERVRQQGIKVPEFVDSLLDFTSLKPSFLPYSSSVYKRFANTIKLDSDFIYDPDFTTPEGVFISNKLSIPLGITLHEPLYTLRQSFFYTYYTLRPFFLRSLDYFIKRSLGIYLLTRIKAKYIRRAKYLSFIAAVSKGTLDSVKIGKVRKYVLSPGNGVDVELMKYRTSKKEDYVVFWTTLIPPKGVLNFLYIIHLLKKRGISIKAKVSGKFVYEKFRDMFFKYVKDKGLDVEYLGFLDKKDLYTTVSKARILIYPSLADGFSLTVLESLALGTPVIAYSIPTVYSVFRDIPAVKFVKEGDVKKFADEVKSELKSGSLQEEINDKRLISFIQFHNWDNVTENIAKIIKSSLNK
ncbi:glycosyltransferase family 4 protein [Saccharolobus solfataricus]